MKLPTGNTLWLQIRHALGIPTHTPSAREQLVAMLITAIGIAFVAWSSSHSMYLHIQTPAMIASIGATAVLVFAVPHGPLSQPWAVIGGQTASALTGLAVAHTMGNGIAAEALSVALAVGAMHFLRCIHPPGGATALSIILATHDTELPDWNFVLNPVLFNVGLILMAAFLLNLPFAWRRYPFSFHLLNNATMSTQLNQEFSFTEDHLAQALGEVDGIVDISNAQLQTLYRALASQQESTHLHAGDLKNGACYSNGLSGELWAIRQIIDSSEPESRKQQLIYKTLAGANRGEIRLVSRQQFASWARYEVLAGDNRWQRVSATINDQ